MTPRRLSSLKRRFCWGGKAGWAQIGAESGRLLPVPARKAGFAAVARTNLTDSGQKFPLRRGRFL